jgi:uncharacterized Zn finger protein (UPF0148 family)
MFGLGGPEVMFLTLLVLAIVLISRMAKGRGAANRFCPACGRGLTVQPPGAAFCPFCGNRLP